MKAGRLKEWMKANNKTVEDVAYETKIHTSTIKRLLNGGDVHRSTEQLLELLMARTPQQQKAAG